MLKKSNPKNISICEEKNYRLLYDLHSKTLRSYIYYISNNINTAEDIVQEAFIKLWENCASVVFHQALFFLKRVSKNQFYNLKRHDKIVLKFKENSSARRTDIGNETPQFILEEKEFALKVKNTIASLPDKQREVFLLNRIDKLKYKEIAIVLDISIKTVEKHISKALKAIRKEIGDI